MAWLFHVLQRADGRWECQHGRPIDQHETMREAIDHCLALAAEVRPAAVVLHRPGEPPERIDVPAD
jgi:hypothetical protein